MIAQIYPFVRLPRRFDFFDYRIPEGMVVSVGDVVRIRFRGRVMLGVVRAVTETSAFPKLFSIDQVVLKGLLTQQDVERLEQIASAVAQSPATVFAVTYGFLKARTAKTPFVAPPSASLSVAPDVADNVARAIQEIAIHDDVFVQTSIEGSFALAHALRKSRPGQLLIIAPRARVAINLSQSVHLGTHVGFLTGQTSATVRESTVIGWAKGEIQTLISTRLGARLGAPNLQTILLLESSSDDYETLERNPRIDARLAAEVLAHDSQAKLVHAGPVPDVLSIHKKRHILWDVDPTPTVINLKELQERTETPLLTQTLKQRMEETLQKGQHVLISFNRRTSKEGAKLPQNTELAQLFALAFPSHRVGVVDKLHREHGSILLVTESYFKNTLAPFETKQFGLVVELDFDLSFTGTDYRAKENAAYKLYRLLYIAKQQKADVVIQTWMPDAVQELLHPQSYLQNEYTVRTQYGLPPVVPRAEITYEGKPQEIIPLSSITTEDLKNVPDNGIIVITTDSYESPNGSHPSE